jgi:hypothetical protein
MATCFERGKTMKIAKGFTYINNGEGYTVEELRDLVKQCDQAEIGIDDTLMDSAAGVRIIESLLNKIEDLSDAVDKLNQHLE